MLPEIAELVSFLEYAHPGQRLFVTDALAGTRRNRCGVGKTGKPKHRTMPNTLLASIYHLRKKGVRLSARRDETTPGYWVTQLAQGEIPPMGPRKHRALLDMLVGMEFDTSVRVPLSEAGDAEYVNNLGYSVRLPVGFVSIREQLKKLVPDAVYSYKRNEKSYTIRKERQVNPAVGTEGRE